MDNPIKEAMSKRMDKLEDQDMDDEDGDIGVDQEESVAAKSVMKALKSGDVDEFAKSLKGFVELCGGY